jgi:type VI secretion system secreted protein Hcp
MANIFMKIDGIDGDATEENHKKWIEVTLFELEGMRAMDTKVGYGGRREASLAELKDLHIVKHLDSASPKLLVESLAGKDGKKVDIHFVTAASPAMTYLEIKLENVLVSGYHLLSGEEAGSEPQENVELNFTKIEYKYTPRDALNKPGSPVATSFDVAAGKSS